MRLIRPFVLFLIFLSSVSLSAQEESAHMTPPPPLEDEYITWMIGEWKGETSSAMGMSTDHMKCEMGLNGQFMIMTYESRMADGGSMSGFGAITLDTEGNPAGYWIDSWRSMSEGHGTREGNISTMKWSTQTGPYVRTTERVDEHTMRITGVMAGPDGKEMRSVTELRRIEK